MATPAFEEIVEDFEFLDDWEDRYRHVIELGKAMPGLDDALKVPATKVDGCASQVWLHAQIDGRIFRFEGDSDALIVRGLVAILGKLYIGTVMVIGYFIFGFKSLNGFRLLSSPSLLFTKCF